MDTSGENAISSGGQDKAATAHDGGAKATLSGASVVSLKQAMRRARFDEAERSAVIMDLRAARIGRLDVLRDALEPLIVQIPSDAAGLFDIAIMPGTNPRLFIDMIGYVEMGRDTRLYRFIQDTRTGRVVLAESETTSAIVEAVTNYIARRLLERDKALAADLSIADDHHQIDALEQQTAVLAARARGSAGRTRVVVAKAAGPAAAAPRRPAFRVLAAILAFIINVLGSIALFGLLAFAVWSVWARYNP